MTWEQRPYQPILSDPQVLPRWVEQVVDDLVVDLQVLHAQEELSAGGLQPPRRGTARQAGKAAQGGSGQGG